MLEKIKQRKEKLETNNNKNLPAPRFWSDVANDYIELVYRLLDNQAIKKTTTIHIQKAKNTF